MKRPVALAVTILATIALTSGSAAASSGLFGAPVTYDSQSASHAAAIADVNGDGKNDLIITNAVDGTEPNTVMVRLGNGNGTFGGPAFYGTGGRPKFTAIADLNGDGKLDLVTANQDASTTSILLGNGNGTFQSKADYGTCSHAHEVAVGDFNHDGKRDLAVACSGGSVISILLGNGNGTFEAKTDIGSGSAPHSLVVGRFNADTYDDLAVANHDGNTVGILLGTSSGSFDSVVTYAVGSEPHSVRSGDFNKDGKTDLATANDGSDNVSVLLGRGDGTFEDAVSYAAGSVPKSVAVGDLNGDGNLDLTASDTGGNGDGVTGLPNGNLISILLGNGDGTFQSPTTEEVGEAPYSAVHRELEWRRLSGRRERELGRAQRQRLAEHMRRATAPASATPRFADDQRPHGLDRSIDHRDEQVFVDADVDGQRRDQPRLVRSPSKRRWCGGSHVGDPRLECAVVHDFGRRGSPLRVLGPSDGRHGGLHAIPIDGGAAAAAVQ